MSFKDLKKSRQSQFEKLTKYVESSSSSSGNNVDNRFWKLKVDEAGNGSAIIRFLPPPEGEDVPFVQYWDHAFQGPGGWYIKNSLTTLGRPDPVSELNSHLWNEVGTEAAKDLVRKRKRRLHYVSNIYVVKDPAAPENEGKVFLYRYGKKIYDMILDAMHPQFDDETPFNPFDFWEGANFRLRARNVGGYRNYDKSEFDSSTPLFKSDEELEAVWNSQHSLQAEISADKFDSYENLKKLLHRVLNTSTDAPESAEDEEEIPTQRAWTPPVDEAKSAPSDDKLPFDPDDDDEALNFFNSIANKD